MTVDQAKQRVLDKARPGAIILLHAGYDITPALLESLRPSLTSQGYHFVTLSTLMAGA
ncbi:MAG: hypothetical protein HY092_02590 [Candidatus Kerfeldbacteria bacterium]|nr:hypothetical protein [Candidatus Kerfeldbacteria bacterium]